MRLSLASRFEKVGGSKCETVLRTHFGSPSRMTRRPTLFSRDNLDGDNTDDLFKTNNMAKDEPKSHAIEFGLGGILGIGSAYLDDNFREPLGLIVGGSLVLTQVLDHFEVIRIPWQKDVGEKWSQEQGLSGFERILASTADFVMKNAAFNGGFATGFLLAQSDLYQDTLVLPKRKTNA